ncbi:CPBP family intramembrane glutamic endopeptidase [Nocardiopsis alkaliphila]|uniref:CPBP family intramembrane glutamic endopeptidase n=1 Tax=Nocardiopsis alkaliphila TaxID=225762 RepID=UPI00034A2DC9|nr:type II CAAX endopeptidase family protein [Nocardiopsis alkaliphila]
MPPELPAPTFTGPALMLVTAIVLYLLVVEPFWGRRMFEGFKRERDTDPNTYVRFFGLGMAVSWGLTGLTALAVLLSPGVRWAHLGLDSDVDWGTVSGMLVGFTGAAVVVALLARRKKTPPASELVSMLPRTTRERWCAVGASVTAGVCEEIVFRGLLIAVGVSFGLPLYAAAGSALAIFTFAHLYQGKKNMLFVALLGFALTYLYLRTGSLLMPIIVHILVDLRALLLTPAPKSETKAPQRLTHTA